MPEQYIWLTWSAALLGVWLFVYILFPVGRKRMLRASLLTMPFGLTEPLFVPSYWNPPSLFDLAQRTGFDLESLLFCFGIGGLGVTLYDFIFKTEHAQMSVHERHHKRHRFHIWTLISPIFFFLFFYVLLRWNAIYAGSLAMFLAALAALWCRPDLKTKIWIGGFIFLLFYALYFLSLNLIWPDYVDRVWNLSAISGLKIAGIPVEELMFAFTFGMLWSSYYEHLLWKKVIRRP